MIHFSTLKVPMTVFSKAEAAFLDGKPLHIKVVWSSQPGSNW